LKKSNREKNPIKSIKIFKKLTGSVRFYKPEIKKTESDPNKKNQKTNRAKLEKTKPKLKKQSQASLNRFLS
jgi:hypothetical protein